MLTFDALIDQAKLRDMPPTKTRGVLREYMQVVILNEFYKTDAGKELYFTGGTYLRLVHNLKRFSEDLDFNTQNLTPVKFENYAEELIIGLKRLGMKSKVQFAHWDNILVAKLTFPEIERSYNIVSQHSRKEGIIIKLETNRQKWKIKTVTEVISGFGVTYPCLCTDKGMLFSDKIDALTKKKRGRHLYDIIFMLSNKFSIDRRSLKRFGIEEDPLSVILRSVQNYTKAELKKQAEILRPFLFDEKEAELVANAHNIMPGLIEQYRKGTHSI